MLTSSRRHAGSAFPGQRRRGFTLVEIIVAIVLLSVGALALASGSVAVLRNNRLGYSRMLATDVAQQRFEQLRSIPCTELTTNVNATTTGSATTRGLDESWKIGPFSGSAMMVEEKVGYVPRAGATNTLVLTSVVPCVP